jgi:uncharacterized protein (TIGR04255 family)
MFGFPKIDRKTFKNNFLRTIVFQMQFRENEVVIEKSSEIKELFKDEFPRAQDSVAQGFNIHVNKDKTPILQSIPNSRTGIELRSTDGQKALNISVNSLTLTITGKAYKNFADVEKLFEKLNQTYNMCGIHNIVRLAIRKVNIIEFEIVDKNQLEVMQYLLSKELLSNVNVFPDSDYINQSIQTINYKKDNCHLNLRYGMTLVPNSNNGQVIIDIDLFDLTNMEIDKISNKSEELNSEIFSIFNWTLSENAKKLLDGKS